MRLDVITIFPEYFTPLELSLVGKARDAGVIDINVRDLRDWTTDPHHTVDDTPYGGGAGMVMRPDVWGAALESVAADSDKAPRLIIPAPAGELFDQKLAARLATEDRLIFACGRYEGIDERVSQVAASVMPVTQVSIGDYVVNGGEVAALVMIEAIARLVPGVVGNPESLVEESHGADGLLEYPVYTKPRVWRDREVPEVLLSGHHGRIARWRRDESLRRTATRRPDLLDALSPSTLDEHDRAVIDEAQLTVDDPRMAD